MSLSCKSPANENKTEAAMEDVIVVSDEENNEISPAKKSQSGSGSVLPVITVSQSEPTIIDLDSSSQNSVCSDAKAPSVPPISSPQQTSSSFSSSACSSPAYNVADSEDKTLWPPDKDFTYTKEFLDFVKQCKMSMVRHPKYSSIHNKLEALKKKFREADPCYVNDKHFKEMLVMRTEALTKRSENVANFFLEIVDELQARSLKNTREEGSPTKSIELRLLCRSLRKVRRKLLSLQDAEVDLDDEQSSYIQYTYYQRKLVEVHRKICKITGENVHASRVTFRKLDYDGSSYSPINRALNKHFNRYISEMPSITDIDRVVRSCVAKEKLGFSESELLFEVRKNFTALGELIQRRRKHELYESMNDYLLGEEPVEETYELMKKLKRSKEEGGAKLDSIFESYVVRQEKGEDVVDDDAVSMSDTDSEKNVKEEK